MQKIIELSAASQVTKAGGPPVNLEMGICVVMTHTASTLCAAISNK